MKTQSFADLGLAPSFVSVLDELEITTPSAVQSATIPLLLEGKDVIAQAQTGSGKTAAFALPLLQNLKIQEKHLQALILCPTRELVQQVVQEVRRLGRKLEGLQVLAVTGGQSGKDQATSLDRGAQIVVGTPGRVLDLIDRQRMDLSRIEKFVLDEADKMLELGFEKELMEILQCLPAQKQSAFFSATFPESILYWSRRFQRNPRSIQVQSEAPQVIDQYVYEIDDEDKKNILMRILQQHISASTLIFCNTKAAVNEILEMLAAHKVDCGALHGDMEQRERDRVMALFRNRSLRILVATDVAARGLDIEGLELVVNYDFPLKPETYVHRIGRTGRAGKSGVAVLISYHRDTLKVLELEKISGRKFLRQPLGFKNQYGLTKELKESAKKTITISGGRKDKLRPGDILGALTGAGGFAADQIGKIEIQDKVSYVAVNSDVAQAALEVLRLGKIKGKRFPVRF